MILRRNKVICAESNLYPLNISAEDVLVIERLLDQHFHTDNQGKLVALVPGAKRPQNRYPLNRYLELSDWILNRGYKILIGGCHLVPELCHLGRTLQGGYWISRSQTSFTV